MEQTAPWNRTTVPWQNRSENIKMRFQQDRRECLADCLSASASSIVAGKRLPRDCQLPATAAVAITTHHQWLIQRADRYNQINHSKQAATWTDNGVFSDTDDAAYTPSRWPITIASKHFGVWFQSDVGCDCSTHDLPPLLSVRLEWWK